jgi:hypothetical protein
VISEQLREVHQSRPFRPFVLHLTDGRKLRVSHPEAMAVTPGGRTAYIVTGEASLQRVDVLLIVSIEEHASGRGRHRSNGRG